MAARFALLALLMWLTGLAASAQEPWEDPVLVPPGVTYKRTDAATLKKAVQFLRTVLAPDYHGPEKLFGSVVACGPFLWDRVRGRPEMAAAEGPPMRIAPFGVEGKGFKGEASCALLEKEIRASLATDGGFKVRRPTSDELALYWALIPYDIDEPIFVVESKRHRYLMHFMQGRVFAVDDYAGASLGRLDELEAKSDPIPIVVEYPDREWTSHRAGEGPQREGPVTDLGVVLLTEEEAIARRVPVGPLADYIKRLDDALSRELKGISGSRDLIVQVELTPSRPPYVQVAARPDMEGDRAHSLVAAMGKVTAPRVRGRVIFQLVARINGGTAAPLGPPAK
ncbi:MAG: hypothetical protein AB1758_26240 [Candidatus Eremiobacterota bacterium]